ncbi:Gfo/Idh/MocA family protein [Agrilactobacillus yilanensis]|uniref:Gfo/Idh/MocA family protein n=1 Tax=Agrilactobacillus yilanensis TaxID=2485997 RepID=A0ABW4J9D8_9LACO|nr:Gfo/Idh/MocA family oxidoreductase [Agrilactobacillus yilanensis]
MLNLGIIGTNWITKQFVQAALATKEYTLAGVYSRNIEKAQAFGQEFGTGIQYFEDMAQFVNSEAIDIIYIASPNSLHAPQALTVINADKHVIVEKPAAVNPTEMAAIQAALVAHPKVYYFEAARQIHEPNFQTVTKTIQGFDHQDGAFLTYMKYSSRFDQYLAGEEPNIFSAKFAGGALQDLGVYLVYNAISWFGVPEKVQYHPVFLRTGVDGRGTAILNYPDFEVTLNMGKNVQSTLASEIYCGKQTLRIDNAGEFNEVTLTRAPDAAAELLSEKPAANPMIHEAQDFATIIAQQDRQTFQKLNQLSVAVNQTMYNLRQSAGFNLPADQ